MSGLLLTSTIGDRKELRALLHRLPPLDRLRFLCECFGHIDAPHSCPSARNMPLAKARTDSSADAWVTRCVYLDLLMLASQFSLDLDAAAHRLAGFVRRPAGLRECPATATRLARALAVGRAVGSPS